MVNRDEIEAFPKGIKDGDIHSTPPDGSRLNHLVSACLVEISYKEMKWFVIVIRPLKIDTTWSNQDDSLQVDC